MPNLLGQGAPGSYLNLLRCGLEISNGCLHSVQELIDGLFEYKAVQGHHRHHWVVRVDADSMLGRHLGYQSLHVY
ncbi:MAG: hypothetical protein QM757_26330 [Paludibaculum sp.]